VNHQVVNPNTVKIRKFRLSDLNEIIRIMQIALPDLYRHLANPRPRITFKVYYVFEKWINRIKRCVKRGSLCFLFTDAYDKIILVAEYASKIVGFIEGFPITDKEWLISAIAVLPNYRKRGIGQKLVKKLISHLKSKRWKKVSLYVKPDNVSAIKLYQKLGFITTTEQKIRMLLNLDFVEN